MSRHRSIVLAATMLIGTSALAQEAPLPLPRPAHAALSQEPAKPQLAEAPLQLAAAPSIIRPSARSTTPDKLDETQRAILQRVNTYFNGIQVLSGNFIQQAPSGGRSEGRFFLRKPGKLRFEFDPPSKLQIIADGKSVAVRDKALATQDIYPLSQTPLRYLLQPNIDLLRDTKVVSITTEPEIFTIAIEETNKIAGTSRLLLVFGGPEYELKQWTVTDPQGMDTTVIVYNLDSASMPNDRLFAIDYTIDPANRR